MEKRTKNILIGAGVLVTGIIGFVIYKKIRSRAELQRDVKAITTGSLPELGINLQEIANQIGIDLGYAFPVYDPRHWSENDTKVKELILKVPKPLIKNLVSAYYTKYKRNLQSDLQSRLDEYSEISYLFN